MVNCFIFSYNRQKVKQQQKKFTLSEVFQEHMSLVLHLVQHHCSLLQGQGGQYVTVGCVPPVIYA